MAFPDKIERWRALGLDPTRLAIEPLASYHDRAAFACGEASLDAYLKTRASQEVKKHVARCFVLVPEAGNSRILGYYTLSAHTINQQELDASSRKKLPPYPVQGAILLGRLAVSHDVQGVRLGWLLLIHALRACLEISFQTGAISVVVDALHDGVVGFYTDVGFAPINDNPLRLHLPMGTIVKLFPSYTTQLRDRHQTPTNPFEVVPDNAP